MEIQVASTCPWHLFPLGFEVGTLACLASPVAYQKEITTCFRRSESVVLVVVFFTVWCGVLKATFG